MESKHASINHKRRAFDKANGYIDGDAGVFSHNFILIGATRDFRIVNLFTALDLTRSMEKTMSAI